MTLPLQGLMNAPAAIGGQLTRRGRQGPGAVDRFGLTMWFKVVIDQIGGTAQSLGRWSACSGLGVTFKPEEQREGGDYNGPAYLPGEIGYGQIVLERAMDHAGSAAVQSWLAKVAAEWINDDGKQPGYQGASMVIKLYSNLKQAADEQIASWELRDVIPVSWSGPTLSARGSEVAVEKLTLAHRGFLSPAAKATGGATTQPAQGRLKISLVGGDPQRDVVDFACNPQKVSLDRSVSIASDRAVVTADQLAVEPGKLSIKVNDLRVEGVDEVHRTVEKLLTWLVPDKPGAAASPAASGGMNAVIGKVVRVDMGAGMGPGRISRQSVLRSVNVTYTRFTPASVPSRASVSLTLEGVDVPPAPQNPTSGGPPGGRVHTVVAGDNLPRIALDTYGSPGSWRGIAEANGIDDPLRVRNGQSIYLPPR